ncbi:unnamed protein product [marine sediment metagenome]|uniref:Uncharacterized protein n=1 Tax=marine sediment metagenome TaxID=412755 RepID=X1NPY6_9ZZZZ
MFRLLALVTRHWIMEPWHKDEIAYAKALGKPFALAIEKGIDPGNWFDGCNVIDRITFDRDNLNDKGITDWLKSVRDYLITKKGSKS